MKLLAIDPGLTTGWAAWNLPGGEVSFSSGMVEGGRFAFYEWLYPVVSAHYSEDQHYSPYGASADGVPFTIICESFTITQATARKSPQPDPWRIIGHVEALCYRDDIPLVFQAPSEAMAFSKNDKLKALGWYKPGAGHDNDAARHLLLWMMKNQDQSPLTRKRMAELLGVVQ